METVNYPLPLPEKLQVLATEIFTYYRELPRLLAEGEEGRIVLIKGNDVISVWDTDADAYQAGAEKFGFGPFLAQPVDSRDIDRLLPYVPLPAGSIPA